MHISVPIVDTITKLKEILKEQHMKLRTTVEALSKAFALVAPTLDNKGSSSNLYLNANDNSGYLYLYSTNLISETVTKIKVEVETSGEVLINPDKLKHGLSELPKDTPVTMELAASGNAVIVKANNVKFSLAANSGVKEISDKVKAMPFKIEPNAIVPARELKEFANRTMFCIPNDQTGQRANLAALKISITSDGEEVYATDGSIAVRLSSTKRLGKGAGLSESILLPAPALQALSTLATKKNGETVSIIVTDKKNKIFFRFADGTHFGALTAATLFPNLKSVVDQKTSFLFTIPRDLLKQSLTRASFFVSSVATKSTLEMEFEKDKLNIRAKGDDVLSDSIPIIYEGVKPEAPVKLGMNISHLVNVTNSSSSNTLGLGFTGSANPLIVIDKDIKDDEELDIRYVIMGTRI